MNKALNELLDNSSMPSSTWSSWSNDKTDIEIEIDGIFYRWVIKGCLTEMIKIKEPLSHQNRNVRWFVRRLWKSSKSHRGLFHLIHFAITRFTRKSMLKQRFPWKCLFPAINRWLRIIHFSCETSADERGSSSEEETRNFIADSILNINLIQYSLSQSLSFVQPNVYGLYSMNVPVKCDWRADRDRIMFHNIRNTIYCRTALASHEI